jgi:hypothetical protein
MGHLSTTQLGELNRAYNDEGVQELQTERITYHDAVSYEVLGQADEFDGRGAEDDSVVKVKVQVGEVIEFRVSEEDLRRTWR